MLASSTQKNVIDTELIPKALATSTPVSEPDAIREIVEQKAEEYGVDKELAIDLCMYESAGCQPEIKNPNSSALGLYQFLTGTWDGLCEGERINPNDNADCAMRLISEGGITHWTADLNTRQVLIEKGYVECPAPEKNYCILKSHLITRQ